MAKWKFDAKFDHPTEGEAIPVITRDAFAQMEKRPNQWVEVEPGFYIRGEKVEDMDPEATV